MLWALAAMKTLLLLALLTGCTCIDDRPYTVKTEKGNVTELTFGPTPRQVKLFKRD